MNGRAGTEKGRERRGMKVMTGRMTKDNMRNRDKVEKNRRKTMNK